MRQEPQSAEEDGQGERRARCWTCSSAGRLGPPHGLGSASLAAMTEQRHRYTRTVGKQIKTTFSRCVKAKEFTSTSRFNSNVQLLPNSSKYSLVPGFIDLSRCATVPSATASVNSSVWRVWTETNTRRVERGIANTYAYSPATPSKPYSHGPPIAVAAISDPGRPHPHGPETRRCQASVSPPGFVLSRARGKGALGRDAATSHSPARIHGAEAGSTC